jgi:hypothetical protein
MPSKLLVFLCLAYCASSVFASDGSKLKAAKQKFERAGGTEAARQEYVSTLAAMLGREMAIYIRSSKRDEAAGQAIHNLDAELKAHPAPKRADSKTLSKLRLGKWQTPRHTFIYSADGTWQIEDGFATTGHWHIEGNRYFDDVSAYTIICLNDRDFVFTDGEGVYYECRLSDRASIAEPSGPDEPSRR